MLGATPKARRVDIPRCSALVLLALVYHFDQTAPDAREWLLTSAMTSSVTYGLCSRYDAVQARADIGAA